MTLYNYKKHIFTLTLALASLGLHAQDIDRTKAPKPLPAPVINIPDAESFTLANGLKVFVVTNAKLPQVSATLTIDKVAIMEGAKAGMADMEGELLSHGTTKMTKEQLDEAVDFLGGDLNTGALSVSASSLTNNFPKVLALMADVALHPSLPAGELEKIRKQTLSSIKSEEDDPNAISSNIASILLYGKNHPYGEIATEESVKSVTLADVKKFYTTNWKPNAAYLIFVGDIKLETAKTLATQYFGAWQKGTVPVETYPAVKAPAKTYIAVVDRPSSVQSVINVVSPVDLKPGSPGVIPGSVMNTILGGGFSSRLVQNLREKHGFTYGASSGLSSDRLVGKFSASTSVRNEKTDSAVGELLYELKRITSSAPEDSELNSLKNYMSGGFARSLERPSTIAGFALNIARYNLPKDYYRTYLTKLSAVSAANVKDAATRFINPDHLIITIVGNAKEIAPGLEKYGEVHYFDIHGNEVKAPDSTTVAVGDITAKEVLENAVKAYGGEAAITSLKDVEMTGTMEIMGQSLTYTQKNVFPADFMATVSMGDMAVMKQSKIGNDYTMQMQGNDLPVDEKGKADIDARAAFVEELYLLKAPGYKFEIKGIEKVNDKDAYVVAITAPSGPAGTAYYDVESGLKVKEMKQADTPMGAMNVTTNFNDYKVFSGIKVPTSLFVDLGQFQQNIKIENVKVNQGLTQADLK